MCGHAYLSDCMIRGQLWVSLLSFRHVEPRDQTLVLKPVPKFLYLTDYLTSPSVIFLKHLHYVLTLSSHVPMVVYTGAD